MTDARAALADLVAQLSADGELDEADLVLIHNAAVAQAQAIQQTKQWAAVAHVHDEPHAPVTTFDPKDLAAYLESPDYRTVSTPDGDLEEIVPPGERIAELVDTSGVICHDCGGQLVADSTHQRILVCAKLHGRRPPELVPAHPDGAVECGQPRPTP